MISEAEVEGFESLCRDECVRLAKAGSCDLEELDVEGCQVKDNSLEDFLPKQHDISNTIGAIYLTLSFIEARIH